MTTETNLEFRARLQSDLKHHLEKLDPCRGFFMARISRARFGIVDRDRANFLGLSFQVEMLEPGGGCSSLYLPTDESLELLKEFDEAENLDEELCWVLCEGTGACMVRFVRMVGKP